MLTLFLLFRGIGCISTNTFDGIPNTKIKTTKFSIKSFSPKVIQASGGELVTITIDKNISSLVFCKFGDKEVTGKKIGDYEISCLSPRIQYSEVLLSVSEDKSKWSLPVTLSVTGDGTSSSISFLIVLFFAILGISYSTKTILFGKKKKKTHKKKRAKRGTLQEPLDGKKKIRKRKPQNTI